MAVTKLSNSGIKTGVLKYDSMLAGNPAYSPATYDSIATFTSTGGESSYTFSAIPSTYKHLQLRVRYLDTYTGANTNAGINVQFNNDTTSSYFWHGMYANGATITASSQDNANSISLARLGWATNTGNPWGGVGIIDILDYANASKYKVVRCFSGGDADTASTASGLSLQSGGWASGATISSIKLMPSWIAFAAGTRISLYGIGA